MKIAVTRPQADSERTAKALRACGHDVLVAPLMRVEPIAADLGRGWAAVVITSANASRAILHHPARATLISLPVYAVGRRSADAAKEAGFANVVSAGGDVRDLAQLIAEHHADAKGPLLYLAGEDRAADLIGELAARGIAAEMRVVYRAAAIPFPPALAAALKAVEIDAVLHFSKRSAESYVAGAKAGDFTAQALEPRQLCLSTQVAAPLQSAGASRVAIATRPDEAALLALVQSQA
jgi:uroporphyrinogen-III synthase